MMKLYSLIMNYLVTLLLASLIMLFEIYYQLIFGYSAFNFGSEGQFSIFLFIILVLLNQVLIWEDE